MHSNLLAVPVLLSLASFGCAPPDASSDSANAGTAATSSNVTASAHRECVIDTVATEKGLLADLRGAVGASFIKEYGGSFYPHIEIPGVFDAALVPGDAFGEAFYTVVGLDIEPETLPEGGTARPRLTAVLAGSPTVDPLLKTSARNYDAAKTIFNAMTRARETTERHIVPSSHVYDQSWIKTTRASANGRVICESTTFPDAGSQEPTIACTFFGIERTHVQIFNTSGTGGKCLAETL